MMQYDQIMADIVRELGLESLPQEKKEEMLAKIGELLMKQIFLETMDRLGEEGATEYERLMESNPEQSAIESFLNEKIPGYNELIAKIVEDFKKEMKEAIIPQPPEAVAEETIATQEESKKSIVQDDRITMLN